ncbi:MAG UNVERIFIED_CONTAM: hypothetical protein LVQ98_08610 [Rickettsiaceae bacterium]
MKHFEVVAFLIETYNGPDVISNILIHTIKLNLGIIKTFSIQILYKN